MARPAHQVFKMQRPLFIGGAVTKDSVPQVLFYNKKRTVEGVIAMTPEVSAMFSGEPKIYVQGYVNNDGNLTVTGPAAPQPW